MANLKIDLLENCEKELQTSMDLIFRVRFSDC